MRTKKALLNALLGAALLAAGGVAQAQSWPERPGKVLLDTGPGTIPDLVTRMVAERMGRAFGKPFVVENLVGGGGMIAAQAAARSAPDGYTFFTAGIGFIATDRYMFMSVPYDTDRDFTQVALLYDSAPFAIAVRPDTPVKNVAELIALAKAQPGKLSYGADSVGATAIIGEWFNKVAGVQIAAIPYKSVAQMLSDALSGQTQVV